MTQETQETPQYSQNEQLSVHPPVHPPALQEQQRANGQGMEMLARKVRGKLTFPVYGENGKNLSSHSKVLCINYTHREYEREKL